MSYEYDDDINGKFLIRRQESDQEDANVEADYIVVHFTVPMDHPILDSRVYVGGDFTYNITDESTQMIYNVDRKAYLVSNRNGEVKSAPIELDAFQTENNYQIFFFHRPMGERYDRLIGYQVINSLR
jgi:hypothetical protein